MRIQLHKVGITLSPVPLPSIASYVDERTWKTVIWDLAGADEKFRQIVAWVRETKYPVVDMEIKTNDNYELWETGLVLYFIFHTEQDALMFKLKWA